MFNITQQKYLKFKRMSEFKTVKQIFEYSYTYKIPFKYIGGKEYDFIVSLGNTQAISKDGTKFNYAYVYISLIELDYDKYFRCFNIYNMKNYGLEVSKQNNTVVLTFLSPLMLLKYSKMFKIPIIGKVNQKNCGYVTEVTDKWFKTSMYKHIYYDNKNFNYTLDRDFMNKLISNEENIVEIPLNSSFHSTSDILAFSKINKIPIINYKMKNLGYVLNFNNKIVSFSGGEMMEYNDNIEQNSLVLDWNNYLGISDGMSCIGVSTNTPPQLPPFHTQMPSISPQATLDTPHPQSINLPVSNSEIKPLYNSDVFVVNNKVKSPSWNEDAWVELKYVDERCFLGYDNFGNVFFREFENILSKVWQVV